MPNSLFSRAFFGSPIIGLLIATLFCSLLQAQTPTLESLSSSGPYQVATYTDFPDVAEFGAGTIYYPSDKAASIGGVAISPGFVEMQENMSWWGPHLASHGFAVLTLDTNEPRDRPDIRATALMAAIKVLREENNRDGSPLKGKIDPVKMAVMGHSMGGGGTLLAANEHSAELKAAIPFTPWQPNADFSKVSIPTLVIAGEDDRIAPKDVHAWPHYQTLSEKIPRMYLEIKGGNHFIANTDTEGERLSPNIDVHDLVGRIGLAWLKLYVDGDEAYRPFIFGELPSQDTERLSKFEARDGMRETK
jgi:predicted dienelactone hydrolase